MGLFSTKTIITVATSVSRVIEDAAVPDSLKTGTIRSILKEGQLIENILDDALNGIGTKAERMYQYGKRSYLYGLPTSSSHLSKSAAQVVEDIIESSEGRGVTLLYYHYGPLNNLHYGWQTLTNVYGYDQSTNELKELSLQKGAPVYLDDLQVVVTEATQAELANGALAQWGVAATAGYTPLRPVQSGNIDRKQTPYGVDSLAEGDYYRLSIIWVDPVSKQVQKELLTFDLPMDSGAEYFQAKYRYELSGKTYIKYFTYQAGTGSYLALDMLFSPEYDDVGSFFPFGYFRYNKQTAAGNPASEEYQASSKLMKYLGISYAQVADAVAQNPGIDNVESALLMMAVPADTTNPLEQKYLFEFFKALYIQSASVTSPNSVVGSAIEDALYGNRPPSSIGLIIQDKRFKSALSMRGIYRQLRYGTIGKIGDFASGSTSVPVTETVASYAGLTAAPGSEFLNTYYMPALYYRKQLTETLYEEYQVIDLRMTYYVWGSYTASTAHTMVPLDKSITSLFPALERERLYARSLHYVFNAKYEQHIKWYQQSWFRFVLIVVALVISYFSMGADGGSALAAAIAAGTAATIEYVVIYCILVPLVMQMAMKLFVKMLGPEFAMVLSLVLAVWAGYTAINAGSIQGAPWAKELLQVSSGLMEQTQAYYTEALKGLSEQATQFSLYAEQKIDELETANKLLEHSSLISPFIIFGESPDDYFNRTVHCGNVGIAGIDAISNYVSISLELPKLSQTISFDQPLWG